MEKTNLLYSIKLPIKDILDKINWFCDQATTLSKKYVIENSFYLNMSDSRYGKNSDNRKFDSITKIEELFDNLLFVTGTHNTNQRSYTYDVHKGSIDEGWGIETGDFVENISAYIPNNLFKLSNEEVLTELNKYYKKDSSKKIKEELAKLYEDKKLIDKKIEYFSKRF
jgi:hypothetical protein